MADLARGSVGGSGYVAERAVAPRGSVTVLLPALNEEQAIGDVLDRIPWANLENRGYDVSVWVVDGQSSDATRDVAIQKGARIFVQDGAGKGNGLRQAFDHFLMPQPRTENEPEPRRLFVMLDSDGTYSPESIPRLVGAMESGSDIVMGSRFLGRIEDGALSALNRMGNRLLTAFARFLYRVPVSDVCTGMWGFTAESLSRLGLAATGFDLEADIFARACQARRRITQVPIDYGRRVGEPKMVPIRAGLRIAWRLLRDMVSRPENGSSGSSTVSDLRKR